MQFNDRVSGDGFGLNSTRLNGLKLCKTFASAVNTP